MNAIIQKVARWLVSLTKDPNDGSVSSTRIAALLSTVTGCVVAVIGMCLNREQASTVTALLGGGVGTFFARAKSTPTGKDV